MDGYFTEQELKREESLIAPHETSYEPVEGSALDIRSFTPPTTEGQRTLPPAC